MNLQARLETLKDRHANLEERIASEDRRPAPDSETMGHLKREKLRLKEEMVRLSTQSDHQHH
ncbi:MAG: YdcH family protein [Proteobacteria bacterium]|nr:YdcH family protein [Pseudomonadota bacterium]